MRQIKNEENKCLDDGGDHTHIWNCGSFDNQWWNVDDTIGRISNGRGCVRANPHHGLISVVKCNLGDKYQKWVFGQTTTTTTEEPTTTTEATTTEVTTTEEPKATTKAPVLGGAEKGDENHAVEEDPGERLPGNDGKIITAQMKHSLGKCLDAGGNHVHMWKCVNNVSHQQWTYDQQKGTIKTATGKCLDGSKEFFQAACKPGDTKQRWNLDGNQIRSSDDKCLSVKNPKTSASLVILKDCNNEEAQTWTLGPFEAGDQSMPESLDYIFAIFVIPMLLLILALGILWMACISKPKDAKPATTPAPSLAAKPDQAFKPNSKAITFMDPRESPYGPRDVGIVAFSYPGRSDPCDDLCQASFLSNFSEEAGVTMLVKDVERKFSNAEAAFRHLQFWQQADEFTALSGLQALAKKRDLAGRESFDYAGFGNQWNAMQEVLKCKFKSGSSLAKALEATGESFLLFHNSTKGGLAADDGTPHPYLDSNVWSNDADGEGSNWLGLQLMLLRDRRTGWKRWTAFIEDSIDIKTGEKKEASGWQDAVQQATAAVTDKLDVHNEDKGSEAPLLGEAKGSAEEGAA